MKVTIARSAASRNVFATTDLAFLVGGTSMESPLVD